MLFSVNTNAGALAALRSLKATNAALARSLRVVATGLEVASAKDDAASFNITQHLRGDIAGLRAAQSSMDRALGAVDLALAAAETIGYGVYAELVATPRGNYVIANHKAVAGSYRDIWAFSESCVDVQSAGVSGSG